MKTVCVFAGARGGSRFERTAFSVGVELVKAGATVVFGGGKNGLMGALADGVHSAGSRAVGIMPKRISDMGLEHPRADTIITSGMNDRKKKFWEECDSYLCLPGGVGTLDELFEIWSLVKLKYHNKPVAILNAEGFFNPLIEQIGSMDQEGFLSVDRTDQVKFFATIPAAVSWVTE